jgi:hypothetical protein
MIPKKENGHRSVSKDLIVDHLHDEPPTLKTCCLVSKSWIHRTRRHFFATVKFNAVKSHIGLWKETFPDPSRSPAHHTRTLAFYGPSALTLSDGDAGGWICTFHNIVHFTWRAAASRVLNSLSPPSADYRPPLNPSIWLVPSRRLYILSVLFLFSRISRCPPPDGEMMRGVELYPKELLSMAEERASRGVKLPAITVISTDALAPMNEVSHLRKHVS